MARFCSVILLLQAWQLAFVSGANILGFGLIGARCQEQSPFGHAFMLYLERDGRGILIVAARAQVV